MANQDFDELEPIARGGKLLPPRRMSMMIVDGDVLEHVETIAAKKGQTAQVWIQNALADAAKHQGFDLLTGEEL